MPIAIWKGNTTPLNKYRTKTKGRALHKPTAREATVLIRIMPTDQAREKGIVIRRARLY